MVTGIRKLFMALQGIENDQCDLRTEVFELRLRRGRMRVRGCRIRHKGTGPYLIGLDFKTKKKVSIWIQSAVIESVYPYVEVGPKHWPTG